MTRLVRAALARVLRALTDRVDPAIVFGSDEYGPYVQYRAELILPARGGPAGGPDARRP